MLGCKLSVLWEKTLKATQETEYNISEQISHFERTV